MADTVAQEITLSAVGGDQVAATFNGVKDSMTSVVGAHENMKAKFTEKFEHVGLKLFAGEMIKSQGLAGEMRPILGGVMLGINSLAGAFGAAAPEILLVSAALLALYEVSTHVMHAHEESIKTIDKSIESNQKEKDALDKVIDALSGTEKAGGTLTTVQENLLKADKALSDHIKNEQIQAYQDLIKQLQAQEDQNAKAAIRAHELHAVLGVGITIWHAYAEAMAHAWDFIVHLIPGYDLLHAVVGKLTTTLGGHAAAIHLSAKEQADLNAKNLESAAAIAKAQAAIEALASGTKKSYDEMRKDAESLRQSVIDDMIAESEARVKANDKAVDTTQKALEHMNAETQKYQADTRQGDNETFFNKNQHIIEWERKQKATIDALYAKDVEYARNSITNDKQRTDAIRGLDTAHENALVALHKDAASKITDVDAEVWHKYQTASLAAIDSTSHAMAQGVAQMIVEGKSFASAFSNIMTMMAEKFIEDVIAMVIEWMVLKAVMEIWPGGEEAYQATANSSFSQIAQTEYGNLGAMADGGTFYADKPTLAVFGEAGPEIATFTPVTKLGASGGSSGTTSRSMTSAGDQESSGQPSQTNQSQTINVGDIHIEVKLDSLSPLDRQMLLRQLGDEVRTASVDAVRFSVASANLANKNSRVAV